MYIRPFLFLKILKIDKKIKNREITMS